ncbi:hypothetical protein GCM10010472_18400 [Pseudonocardia halophobica]|uniref:Quinol monooxygenase YgiN n=1 Tax=Pseudonocardia halophobica TaxID=29401 RepID=A0A9W6KXR7_9PSEU|nr:hypothetical protein [Pseudonocardia halophobica]GLL09946.1 hypothetical protein GCM10017577_10860 [Pseudonocardia halophobica]
MSVVVMITLPGVREDRLLEVNRSHEAAMKRIIEDAQAKGAVHHAFSVTEDGACVVIDEWSSREAFDEFFAAQQEIPEIMRESGATGSPAITSYRLLETSDRF